MPRTPQVKRSGPFAENDFAREQPIRVGGQPIDFLRADDKAAIDTLAQEPISSQREAVEKSARVTDQRVVDGGRAEQSGEVTGGRVKDGFGKNKGAGRGRIVERFVVKPARIIHAAGHDAENDAEPQRAVAGTGRIVAQGFESSGDGVLSNWTGATQPRVCDEVRPR